MIEVEKKVMLSKYQYDRIQELFEFSAPIRQINFYYDDIDKNMIKSGNVVRIRSNKTRMELQMKKHLESGEYGVFSEEFSMPLESVPYMVSSSYLYELSRQEFPEVYLLGFLVTDRKVCNYSKDIQLVLDENFYLDCRDYELELEYTCDYLCVKPLVNILKENGIEFYDMPVSKSKRFSEKYYSNKD